MISREEKKQPTYRIDSSIRIRTKIGSGTFNFLEIFGGFEDLETIRSVFGEQTSEVLQNLKVEVFPREGFMGVSDEDGHIFASQSYLNGGAFWSIYLDTIHELVHVRQFFEGKSLFDQTYSYVDRPTEIEAYRVCSKEARRIGLQEEEILAYLEVPWISKKELARLALACNVPRETIEKSARKRLAASEK